MNELPQWVPTVISNVCVAVITYLATRRRDHASTLASITEVADSLAKQLRAVEKAVPGWKLQIAQQTMAAELCQQQLAKYQQAKDEAKCIAEELSHIKIARVLDEPESPVEARIRKALEAAQRMAALELT